MIKDKRDNSYKLAPIYDCGNSFYSKTSEDKINSIMSDKIRLLSSSLNGITAYVDMEGKRISAFEILKYVYQYNKESIKRVYNNFTSKLDDIYKLFNNIPANYKDVVILSDARKEYYFKSIIIRLKYIEDNFINI